MLNLNEIVENIKKKDFNQALQLCNLYEDKKNKHIILNLRGIIYLQKNDLLRAENLFLRSFEINDKFEDPIKNLCIIYSKKKSFKQLLIYSKKLFNINKSNKLYTYQLAYAFELNNYFDEAIKFYEIYLNFGDVNKKAAFNNIGAIYLKKNEPKISLKYFLQAIELGEDKIIVNNILNCYIKLRDLEKAELFFSKANNVDENFIEFNFNKAEYLILRNQVNQAIEVLKEYKEEPKFFITLINLYFNLGQSENAYKLIDSSEDKIKKNPEFYKYYGLWSLNRGNFEDGWKYYEYRNSKNLNYFYDLKEWSGENINDKKIVVFNEQGIGDSIQFSKYIFSLTKIAKHVTFVVQKNIKNLFKEDIRNLSIKTIKDCEFKKYDFKIALGSLIKFFYKKKLKSNENIINYAQKNQLKEKISANKLNVGLSWSGTYNGPNEPYRSIPLKSLKKIFSLNANFYCLQNNIREGDLKLFNSLNLINFGDYKLDELTSIIQDLDLVIAVDTSILHLSAVLNKETWAMFTMYPDWRWGEFDKFNPYSNLKIFKQKIFNNWTHVEDSMFKELNTKINEFDKMKIS